MDRLDRRVAQTLREGAQRLAEAEAREALYLAVKYALDRQQTDGDFGYVASWGTEVFRLLCLAEAAYLGRPFEEVEKERLRTAWRYRPRVEELQERIQELQERIQELQGDRHG